MTKKLTSIHLDNMISNHKYVPDLDEVKEVLQGRKIGVTAMMCFLQSIASKKDKKILCTNPLKVVKTSKNLQIRPLSIPTNKETRKIIIPVLILGEQESSNHWMIILVHRKRKDTQITLFDSLPTTQKRTKVNNLILEYMRDKIRAQPQNAGKPTHTAVDRTITQTNELDCGAYVMGWANNQVCKGQLDLTADTETIRKRVFNHIVNNTRIHIPPTQIGKIIRIMECGICCCCPCHKNLEGP